MLKLITGIFACIFIFSGCTVRTYKLTKERVDQDLSAGNRGYLMGKPSIPEKERKTTRTVQVVEVELGQPAKVSLPTAPAKPLEIPSTEETYTTQEIPQASIPSEVKIEETPQQDYENYTVKKGDTLQKISQKFYGTTKKWKKIFEANRDVLKSPDKIYAGQILRIPLSGMQKSESLPEKHLK